MKKITNLFFLFLLVFVNSNSQTSYFYYYKGQKVNITVDREYLNIIADNEFLHSSNSNKLFQELNIKQDDSLSIQGIVKLKFKTKPDQTEYSEAVNILKQNEYIKYILPFFERKGTSPIGTSDIFYVMLKEIKDTILIRNIAEQKNVQILKQVQYMPLWYILSIQNSTFENSLEATNYFFETGYFEDVDPAFMFNFRGNCTNDPKFNELWGLENPSYYRIDINACNAWTITRGERIKVAVLDDGIYTLHDDLEANIHPMSFDALTGTSPSVFRGNSHGTHVAGIIAAVKDNNLQVVGVSPESKIMGVSHSMKITYTYLAEMANGISWAWKNGADVINNSWGDHNDMIYNTAIIENAIDFALRYGRGEKGCIVVFASGNNTPEIHYPANSLDDIMTVGSIIYYGLRAENSAYGTKLNVVAPGVDIYSTTAYNNIKEFSGTSQAAPHVAGVAALVLSVNPNLTGQQVRNIIESTAQKINPYSISNPDGYNYTITPERPNGTWHEEVGYGLVDAHAAVLAALENTCYTGLPIINGNISQNTTINTPSYACGKVSIPNGVTLTITSVLECDFDASIIIEPGGKLILDGGTLKNACEEQMWQGITVMGDPTQPLQQQYQGYFQILSNGTIENAQCGIHSIAGGIIKATEASFINNTVAVKIDPVNKFQIAYK